MSTDPQPFSAQDFSFHFAPEIADRYGVTKETVSNWIKRRYLRAFQPGNSGHYLIRGDWVYEFEQQYTQHPEWKNESA